MKRIAKTTAIWIGVAALTVALLSTVLPWAAEQGYAGTVIQQNVRDNRDASGLFYTEVEGMDGYERTVTGMITSGDGTVK